MIQPKRSFVNCRYVLDLHKFNEWPNIQDYNVDQRLVAKTQIRFQRRHEKSSQPIKIRLSRKNRNYRILEISGGSFYEAEYDNLDSEEENEEERKEEEIVEEENSENDDEKSEKTSTKRKRPSSEILKEVKRPSKQQRGGEEEKVILFVSDENGERYNELLENDTKTTTTTTSTAVASVYETKSSSMKWFNLQKIHFKERLELPEWFDGTSQSKTPRIYQQCRNHMIKKYESNPTLYLSATECRRMIAGDACSLMRVHSFLERHGLINTFALSKRLTKAIVSNDFRNYLFDLDDGNKREEKSLSVLSDAPTRFASLSSCAGAQPVVIPSLKLKKEKKNKEWTREEIQALLNALNLQRLEASKSGRVVEPSWESIAKVVGKDRTAEECEMKFLGFRITDSSAVDDDSHVSSSRVIDPDVESLISYSERLRQKELHLKKMQSLLENERREIAHERDALFLERLSVHRNLL